jgi:hypothetical protein
MAGQQHQGSAPNSGRQSMSMARLVIAWEASGISDLDQLLWKMVIEAL